MSAGEPEPSERISQLRAALLTGRGPGASEQEIADHTRDRALLGAVPAPVELALVARQAGHLHAGEPITSHQARSHAQHGYRRAALLGAATALLTRSIGLRLLRSRRATHR